MNLARSTPMVGTSWLCSLLLSLVLGACAKPAPVAQHALTAEELLQRAQVRAAQGDDLGAEQYLGAARAAGYDERRIVRELINVCAASGRLESALLHARNYLDRHPDDWPLQHVVATLHLAKGDSASAQEELLLLTSEHPEHAESQFLLGLVRRDGLSDVVGAREAFSRYLALKPEGDHAGEVRVYLRRSERFEPPSESAP